MESIGNKFKEEREKKELSIHQVARDTKISKRYIVGLEDENFSIFPGDTYLVGFIRTYSDYLDLNSEEMISLYKNLKIQEQPPPMEELLEKKNNASLLYISLGAVALVVSIIIGIYFIVGNVNASLAGIDSSDKEEDQVSSAKTGNAAALDETEGSGLSIFRLGDNAIDRRFSINDRVLTTIGKKEYSMIFEEIDDTVTMGIPSGKSVLSIGNVLKADLNNDGVNDVSIELYDIDRNAAKINAQVRFRRIGDSSKLSDGAEPLMASTPGVGSSKIPERKQKLSLILESADKKSFILSGTFRRGCLLRTIVDEQDRVERYYSKGETVQLNIEKNVRIWIANAGFIKFYIDGYDIPMGRNGEVAAKLIKWIKNEQTGLFELQCVPMY